jgi:hypothetical protein
MRTVIWRAVNVLTWLLVGLVTPAAAYGLDIAAYAAIASVAATVATTAISAYSSYQQGQQAEKAGKYNAQVAENQAIMVRQAAGVREEQHRARVRALAGQQRAGVGASGVEEAGSPLLVMADTLQQAELDAQRIRYGGEVSATGYESQARLQRYQGGQYATAGMLGAGQSLLSGAATLGRMYRPGTPYRNVPSMRGTPGEDF